MKIKFFKGVLSGTTPVGITEDEINNFIKDKKVIDIKYQESNDYNNFISFLILYED